MPCPPRSARTSLRSTATAARAGDRHRYPTRAAAPPDPGASANRCLPPAPASSAPPDRESREMGTKHTVRFEPVGIEIEVDEDETVLNAAFRQGVMLMHGCKEGQCSACKSFLVDGELDMDRY